MKKYGLGLVVALLLVVGAPVAAEAINEPVPPHLPTEVNAPGTWSDAEGFTEDLAAIGLAPRTRTEGLTGKKESLELFGVSADDGRAKWIELPGEDVESRPLVGWFALSPDGQWIGWTRVTKANDKGEGSVIEGWSVMSTTTGSVRRLDLPTQGEAVENASDLTFSGDSRYLVAGYDPAERATVDGHYFVAWDVKTGASTVLEKPGPKNVPSVGSAPSGVVWAHGSTIFRVDPAMGEKRSFTVPGKVTDASWAPDDEAFAYLSRPTDDADGPVVLHAGRTLEEARDRVIPLDVEPGQLLGWRNDEKLVVGHFRDQVQVVDITTGDARTIDLDGEGDVINTPLLAQRLWEEPLKAPVVPGGTTDPRHTYFWIAGGLVVLLALGGAFRRRRPGARQDV